MTHQGAAHNYRQRETRHGGGERARQSEREREREKEGERVMNSDQSCLTAGVYWSTEASGKTLMTPLL